MMNRSVYHLLLLFWTTCFLASTHAAVEKPKNLRAEQFKKANKDKNGRKTQQEKKLNKKKMKALKTANQAPMKRRFRKKRSLASVLFPGVSPNEYDKGEDMPVWVEQVESKKTQVPIQFYYLPGVCSGPSQKTSAKLKKSLGARLMGQEVLPSPYLFQMKEDVPPTKTCETVVLTSKQISRLKYYIARQYRVNMNLDDLPVVMRLKMKSIDYSVKGYPIGFRAPPSYSGLDDVESFLYNHLRFTVRYRNDPGEFAGYRIVGFEVMPVSYEHQLGKDNTLVNTITNNPKTNLLLKGQGPKKELTVTYSYEVKFVESDTFWSDRWDVYLVGNPDEDVHLYAIMNSLMICLFMTSVVITVMLRTLRKEINAYNSSIGILEEDEEDFEDAAIGESGWKLVHGDVFRAPAGYSSLGLSICVGTGLQIGCTLLICAVLMLIPGVMNPMNKGKTLSNIVFVYVFSGSASGYMSARIYKLCGGKDWKKNTLYTAVAFPGILVSLFTMLNIFLAFSGAATSVGILTIFLVFLLWLCVSTPLVFVGAYVGFRREKIEIPTRVNQIARVIPQSTGGWSQLAMAPTSYYIGGLLPFGSICIEMFFLMNALWLSQVYYMAGVLAAVLVVLVMTSAQVNVVMCYLQLCAEDHRWWIRSFLNAASTGAYLFGYGIWFLITKLKLVGILPVTVYLTYMFMIALAFALFLGSIGFLACLSFTRMIYGALKVD